jgi:hypothetical protein
MLTFFIQMLKSRSERKSVGTPTLAKKTNMMSLMMRWYIKKVAWDTYDIHTLSINLDGAFWQKNILRLKINFNVTNLITRSQAQGAGCENSISFVSYCNCILQLVNHLCVFSTWNWTHRNRTNEKQASPDSTFTLVLVHIKCSYAACSR